jgi:hypothetical protein
VCRCKPKIAIAVENPLEGLRALAECVGDKPQIVKNPFISP